MPPPLNSPIEWGEGLQLLALAPRRRFCLPPPCGRQGRIQDSIDAVHVTCNSNSSPSVARYMRALQYFHQQPAARAAREDGSKMEASIMTPTRIG